jgi:phage shock protein C
MRLGAKTFEVDRENGKLLGVCAGIANATGIDATIIRVGFVLTTVFLHGFPWTLVAYGILALVGQRRGTRARHRANHAPTGEDARERMRNLDLRMQAIETYVTSSNSRLAREIDELR